MELSIPQLRDMEITNIPLKCAWAGRAKALRYKENGTMVFFESLRCFSRGSCDASNTPPVSCSSGNSYSLVANPLGLLHLIRKKPG